MTIRVVLAEDHYLLRAGIVQLLRTEPDLELVEVCSDLPELLAACDRHRPDAVLTDIRMPPSQNDEGIRAAEYCRRHLPATGVVLLSQYVEPAYVRLLLSQGGEGRGYLLKERVGEIDQLADALRSVATGGSAIDPKVVEALVRRRSGVGGGDLSVLTAREREVLAVMAQGRTNAGVASALVLSQKAVEKHINSIFSKLGLTGTQDGHPRVRAVLRYLAEDSA
ncbi:DNA-binding NarL/FixJ family response regulator [Streptacidiphilus sp. MAP12-16]|uniref:response regulator transcription factor n=1 Tax=Streptacidiphilus sp. MAP12-16 TaxID=3156300 RepID=UPI003511B64B